MTAYTPTWRVKVEGVEVTNATFSNVSIISGRKDIYSQPNAGYCQLNLVKTDGSPISFDVNDAVTIELKNSSGTWITVFGGNITDVDIAVGSTGSIATRQNIRLIALGLISRLPKSIYTGNVAGANDGDQIKAILQTVLIGTWSTVPSALKWNTYDATTTWINAENNGLGEIDTPGDYLLDTLNGVSLDVYSLVGTLAVSGLGYIYEDSQGRVCYADSTHRSQYLAANGYVEMDAAKANAKLLTVGKRIGDVRNSMTIEYSAAGNQNVTVKDTASISLYGEVGESIRTTLKNLASATVQANFYLTLRANPQTSIKSISFDLVNPALTDAQRNALIGIFMGMPVDLINLPSNMAGGRFQGFVEGWSINAGFNTVSITAYLSPLAFSLQSMAWQDVPVTESWNTLNPVLDWINATMVA